MKVAAAYVHGGSVRHEFMVCLQDLVLRERRIAAIIQSQGPYIPQNRNLVCEKFLQLPFDCEWLWFFDIDIEFGPEILDKLLDAADPAERPVIGALYLNQVTGKPAGSWWPTWSDETGRIEQVVMGQTYNLKTIGMGCTLIHRRVIEKLHTFFKEDPWPWFGHDILYRYADDGERIPERVGEDETFCHRAMLAGFKVHGLAELVTHHKHVPIGHDYLRGLTVADHTTQSDMQKRPADGRVITLAEEKELDKHSVGSRGSEVPVKR